MKENTVFDRILCAIFLDFSDQKFDFISLFFIFPHFKKPIPVRYRLFKHILLFLFKECIFQRQSLHTNSNSHGFLK